MTSLHYRWDPRVLEPWAGATCSDGLFKSCKHWIQVNLPTEPKGTCAVSDVVTFLSQCFDTPNQSLALVSVRVLSFSTVVNDMATQHCCRVAFFFDMRRSVRELFSAARAACKAEHSSSEEELLRQTRGQTANIYQHHGPMSFSNAVFYDVPFGDPIFETDDKADEPLHDALCDDGLLTSVPRLFRRENILSTYRCCEHRSVICVDHCVEDNDNLIELCKTASTATGCKDDIETTYKATQTARTLISFLRKAAEDKKHPLARCKECQTEKQTCNCLMDAIVYSRSACAIELTCFTHPFETGLRSTPSNLALTETLATKHSKGLVPRFIIQPPPVGSETVVAEFPPWQDYLYDAIWSAGNVAHTQWIFDVNDVIAFSERIGLNPWNLRNLDAFAEHGAALRNCLVPYYALPLRACLQRLNDDNAIYANSWWVPCLSALADLLHSRNFGGDTTKHATRFIYRILQRFREKRRLAVSVVLNYICSPVKTQQDFMALGWKVLLILCFIVQTESIVDRMSCKASEELVGKEPAKEKSPQSAQRKKTTRRRTRQRQRRAIQRRRDSDKNVIVETTDSSSSEYDDTDEGSPPTEASEYSEYLSWGFPMWDRIRLDIMKSITTF